MQDFKKNTVFTTAMVVLVPKYIYGQYLCEQANAGIVWEFLCFTWGYHRTLVGIGADAAPAGQRPGPILSPWADCSSFTSELDFGEDSSCNHSLDATS